MVGLYFLGLIVGLLASVSVAPRLLERKGIGWTLAFACAIAGQRFLYLAFVSPPVSFWWRVAGMAVIGFSPGLLHTAIFHAVSPMYQHDPAATVNLAGILFGLGCLTIALLISGDVLCVHGVRATSVDRGDSGAVRLDLPEDAVPSASRSAPAFRARDFFGAAKSRRRIAGLAAVFSIGQ